MDSPDLPPFEHRLWVGHPQYSTVRSYPKGADELNLRPTLCDMYYTQPSGLFFNQNQLALASLNIVFRTLVFCRIADETSALR